MKKVIIVSIISVIVGLATGWLVFRSGPEKSEGKERKVLYYRDPMNPQLTSPTPKKSSDGMDFTPVYAEEGPGSGEKKIAYYKDPMHPWYTSDKPGKAPDCGMDLVPVYEGESDANAIRIDPATVQNIGVKVEEVQRRRLSRSIRTVGQIAVDERRVYSVNTKIMGWVEKLYVDYTGKIVRKGEPLLELYSPDLVNTEQEYLLALRNREQLQMSTVEEAKKGADDLVESARRRLQNWDISPQEIQEIEKLGAPKKALTIYSPADGIVMEKMVVNGQNIMAGMALYKIADLSNIWVLADIYQYELPWVKVGDNADLELTYLPGKKFRGTVTYLYPYLSGETRTAKVRIELKNTPGLEFKPDMYATVTIASPVSIDAVAVPNQAIIRSGERNVVIIALGGGYFEPRDVKLGVIADDEVQILDGVREGEKIVVSSQFLIDSESNLKAAIGLMSGRQGMPAPSDSLNKEGTDIPEPIQTPKKRSEEHSGHDASHEQRNPDSSLHSGHTMDDMK